MSETDVTAFLKLAEGRHGHFLMESGYHSDVWLDLDALFADPKRIMPIVSSLVNALRAYNVDAVCGPLLGGAFLAQLIAHELNAGFAFSEKVNASSSTGMFAAQYRLPPALSRHLHGKRIAMVDDVMSAGSSLRSTYTALLAAGAVPVVAGALLILGDAGVQHFTQLGIAVEAPMREAFKMWTPEACPFCAAGITIETVASP